MTGHWGFGLLPGRLGIIVWNTGRAADARLLGRLVHASPLTLVGAVVGWVEAWWTVAHRRGQRMSRSFSRTA
jgi:hypothetical protein